MASTEAKSSEHFLFSCHLPDKDCRVLLGGAAMSYAAGFGSLIVASPVRQKTLGRVTWYCGGIIMLESRSVVGF
jgi:hypothetical protein